MNDTDRALNVGALTAVHGARRPQQPYTQLESSPWLMHLGALGR